MGRSRTKKAEKLAESESSEDSGNRNCNHAPVMRKHTNVNNADLDGSAKGKKKSKISDNP